MFSRVFPATRVASLLLILVARTALTLDVSAPSCSAIDVDATIAQVTAAGGGSVLLPPCDIDLAQKNFHVGGGIAIIGSGQGVTVLRNAMFTFSPQHYGSVGDGKGRLSGLTIRFPFDQPNGMYLELRRLPGMRVDHVSVEGRFSTMTNVALPDGDDDAYVLFDYCHFDLFTSYGIYTFGNNEYRENIGSSDCVGLFGTGQGAGGTVFVEDCEFEGFYHHLMDGRLASHYVFRHNTITYNRADESGNGGGPVEGHGPTDPAITPLNQGTNCMEIYDVSINQTIKPSGAGILFRSGCGVVYNTTVTNQVWGIALAVEDSPYNWNTHPYPAENQPHGLWFWDNTFVDISTTDIGIVWASDAHILEDRDYFLRAPSVAEDGFSYTPYPYPHPVTGILFSDGFEAGDLSRWSLESP